MQEALGRRVRQLRKNQGYSQEAFADKTGLHRTWMGAVERGEPTERLGVRILIDLRRKKAARLPALVMVFLGLFGVVGLGKFDHE